MGHGQVGSVEGSLCDSNFYFIIKSLFVPIKWKKYEIVLKLSLKTAYNTFFGTLRRKCENLLVDHFGISPPPELRTLCTYDELGPKGYPNSLKKFPACQAFFSAQFGFLDPCAKNFFHVYHAVRKIFEFSSLYISLRCGIRGAEKKHWCGDKVAFNEIILLMTCPARVCSYGQVANISGILLN